MSRLTVLVAVAISLQFVCRVSDSAETSEIGPAGQLPPVTMTTDEDHQQMMAQLGITRLRPGPSGTPKAPNSANYDESQANPYPDLPSTLVLNDGSPVMTAEQWWKQRRPEIVEAFEKEVYGRVPLNVPAVTWELQGSQEKVVADILVIEKELIGHVDNSACPAIEVKIDMSVVTPKMAKAPVPVLMMYGFGRGRVGNAGGPPPGSRSPQGPSRTEQLVKAGWGYATIVPNSIQADNGAGLTRGIIGLTNRGQPRKPDDGGALRAWAWGASRGLDYLEKDPAVDAKRVGIEGVSRHGKAALVAMAFDPRFAVALVGSSGEGGAKLHRRNFGEAVENLTGSGEYHWMAGNFLKYGAVESSLGSKNASDIPVDAHQLIALCAPRPTFISYGIPEKGDANWLDQRGSFMATVAAGSVFRLLGAKDLGLGDDYLHASMPAVNQGLLNGTLAWRQHDGGHTDGPNFPHFIAWANRQLGIDPSLGVFTAHSDVGAVQHPGSVRYDAATQSFEISGSGSNMWFDKDEFQFVWRRLKGDFILQSRANWIGAGIDPHRKFGWMVRSSLDTDSPYADAAIHGDGITSLQFRRAKGGNTEEVKSDVEAPDMIQLERQGNTFTMSVAKFGDRLRTTRLEKLDLGDDVYIGLFVCSHRADATERATFRNVRIIRPAKKDFRPYRDYIGSRLETIDVETCDRQVWLESADAIQAPNWTVDRALIYNNSGRLYRFDLGAQQSTPIDTGFANRNNNDHALSFDGTMLAISHHSDGHQGKSIIYTVPLAGGTPKQVTSVGPSYLHGWSPDGRFLTFTGERNGEFDIYKISVDGGDEIRLTTSPGLDDGAEYSPDGEHIYFNSARNGTMQIWRMKADGSEQEPLTNDELNNWFPHVSPDGRWLVFLSFSSEVGSEDHPFYQHVYLRRMPVHGGAPQVIAYVYGGQGTINVPSWSPDSRHVAFVSNSITVSE